MIVHFVRLVRRIRLDNDGILMAECCDAVDGERAVFRFVALEWRVSGQFCHR